MTIGNRLIASFVCGIAMAASERKVPEGFVELAENTAILQVLTFFVFGALIVATGFHHDIPPHRLHRLRLACREVTPIFDIAAIAIICSIVAHGLTDTVGAQWLARPVGLGRPG